MHESRKVTRFLESHEAPSCLRDFLPHRRLCTSGAALVLAVQALEDHVLLLLRPHALADAEVSTSDGAWLERQP